MAKPKTQRLPGMEDAKLADLESAAREYAEVRDDRIELNQREADLKAKLLGLMKKHRRETYVCDDVEINVVHEVETVKVRIHKKKADEESD